MFLQTNYLLEDQRNSPTVSKNNSVDGDQSGKNEIKSSLSPKLNESHKIEGFNSTVTEYFNINNLNDSGAFSIKKFQPIEKNEIK